jgi:predicted AlkP superfamily phosphohydrolase/phosphomutase
MDSDSMIAYMETAASRRVPAVWTLLGEQDRRVGMLNVPMTDPPDPVNGFLVAGLPHPDTLDYASPTGVEASLRARGYLLDEMGGALLEGKEADLEEEVFTTFRRRREAALALGNEHPELDLYWVVFTGTDRMQHFFWKFMDPEHPYHDPERATRFGDSILNLYREVDEAVGALIDQASVQASDQGRELAVIVLSDHGFYGVHRAFRMQSFLRNPPDGAPPITDTYSLETNSSMLYVPLRGRERDATLSPEAHEAEVEEVLKRVVEVRNPEDGTSPVSFGATRERIYSGRYVDKAPDLIFLARAPYYLVNEEGDKEPFGSPEFSFSGHHDVRGILIASGPMFQHGRLEGRQSLLDLSPTLMYLAGLTVPGYMEGDVLTDLFQAQYVEDHPVLRDDSDAVDTGNGEQDQIKGIPYVQ